MSAEKFFAAFGRRPQYLFAAPGRTELGGNHTDHQRGRVLAAAVDLDTRAWVSLSGSRTVRVLSEGYPLCQVDLDDLAARPEERNTTASLVRGMAAVFAGKGEKLSGFDAFVTSTVLPGSGLSSSAAFEVLVGTVMNVLFCEGRYAAPEVAAAGQKAENDWFGKPCGLMDQTASAVGGVVSIDFADPSAPLIEALDLDLRAAGYDLCIIDTGADHADLTDEYAAVPSEMKKAAALFGKEVLREVPKELFLERISEVRKACGDRAALRCLHFYDENERVPRQAQALREGDMDRFLRLVNESGLSSWTLLQNVVPAGYKEHQEMAVSLALASELLGGRGACRVHGGGFAGTIQAFVPRDRTEAFRLGMDRVLGEGSCHVLNISREGGRLVERYDD